MKKRTLVSFDWAMKKLLRSKANFEILEGFLSELLKEDIKIEDVLESESNKETQFNKFNRVDLNVRNAKGEIIIIEVQYSREFDYLQRILFGTAKAITEHMDEQSPYSAVKKIISVNIIYFDLGLGDDYVYKGTTSFIGIHKSDELELSEKQKELYHKEKVWEIYPEYYLIKVNQFDDVAKDTLDEWIYFFKNEEIKEGFTAKGLTSARNKLDVLKLSETEKHAYETYMDNLRFEASMVESTYVVGKMDGKKEGREEGIEEGRKEGEKNKAIGMAKAMKQKGIDLKTIAEISGLSFDQIDNL